MKKTLVDLFEEAVQQHAQRPFLYEKTDKKYIETTYAQTHDLVYRMGAGLKALGVEKNDRIALLSEGKGSWIISELAMFYAGAINVPLSVKLEETNDLLFRIEHSDAKYVIVSGQQLPKIRAIKDKIQAVTQIVVLDHLEKYEEREMALAEIYRLGKVYFETHSKEEFLQTANALQNDDYATITYTSGTTAEPKGVILTHRNYTANVEQSLSLLSIPPGWINLIILPLDHCFAHVVGFYIFMKCGGVVAFVQTGKTPLETLKNIPLNIKEVKPHLLLSVPALAKNFKKNIENGIKAKGGFTVGLFNLALKTAIAYNQDGWNKGAGWRIVLKPFVSLFDKILFSKIRDNFGGNLQFFVGGGALLDKDLQQFYYALGIPMFQGYGLSEATPVISSNGPVNHKFGSSGVLVQPLDIKILDNEGKELPLGEKGEIVVRGENVMAGYWKNPASSAETVREGWLYTGDMGYMGEDGYLYVMGRFKSLLIGSDGEKYSPEGIEEAMVSLSPAIDQIMLYNNQNPYTVALIVPNKEYLKKHIHHHHDWNSEKSREEAVLLIKHAIDQFKGKGHHAGMFPERWLPSTFAILPEPFTEQNRMVNSTMKMVRGKIEEAYAAELNYLYTAEAKNLANPMNCKNVF
ncbi:AMP-dependent synthetase/ligase [Parabacteroides sp. FAFU027]|uniref:AMP-dependent synthetase/ligase n=1 Tax=Parabacteroides sp. FAFU027 TaxID=2922715 RepID=UPI001FAF4C8D|nr:AMP-binding protein [Parabacteroides sp. FAFU027]